MKDTTYAKESIKRRISEKIENQDTFQDYNESYADYTYWDASSW